MFPKTPKNFHAKMGPKTPYVSPYLTTLPDQLKRHVQKTNSYTRMASVGEYLDSKNKHNANVVNVYPWERDNPSKGFLEGVLGSRVQSVTARSKPSTGLGRKKVIPNDIDRSVEAATTRAAIATQDRLISDIQTIYTMHTLSKKRPGTSKLEKEKGMSCNPKENAMGDADVTDEPRPSSSPGISLKSILKLTSSSTSVDKPQTGTKLKGGKKLPFSFAGVEYVGASVPRNKPNNHGHKGTKKKQIFIPEIRKVHFDNKVLIHFVPYESRGSTEWQYNLTQARENMVQSLFMDNRNGFGQEAATPLHDPLGYYMSSLNPPTNNSRGRRHTFF